MENYYLVLELPIERTAEGAEVEAALERKQREWNSSNNTQVKARVTQYISSGVIRTAASDKAQWKRVCDEAREIVDGDLGNKLSIVAASLGGALSKKDIEGILGKFKYKKSVTYGYADGLRKRLGIALSSDTGGAFSDGSRGSGEDKPRKRASLSDYEPESAVRFSSPAKQLQIVGCADYYDFLRKYSRGSGTTGADTAFSARTDAKLCADAAREIEKAWSGKKEDAEKSAVDKVCDQIMRFASGDKAASKENYDRYLTWRAIKDVFGEFWSAVSLVEESRRAIDDKVKATLVSQLTAVTSDRRAAEDLLTEYCTEKKIALPKKLPDVAVCPFCDNPFSKGGKMPESCPGCHRSFLLKCPVCGRQVNYAETRECCGFDLDLYPAVESLCREAESFAQSFDLSYADSLLADAEKLWHGHPSIASARAVTDSRRRLLGGMRTELDKALSERRVYAARTEYENIRARLPGFRDAAAESRINSSIAEAERLLAAYRREPSDNVSARLRLLVKISSVAADMPGLEQLIGSIPVKPVKRVSVTAEQNTSRAGVVWDSANEQDTVEYVLLRKEFGKPLGMTDKDAAVLTRTTERSYSDSGLKAGVVYFYAVYAVRGTQTTALTQGDREALIFPRITQPVLVCDESMIQASWSGMTGRMTCEVYRCLTPMEKLCGQGERLREVTANGFADSGLKTGERYYYNIFFTVTAEGKRFVSDPVVCSGVPSKKSSPPCMELRTAAESGRYEIEITEGLEEDCTVQFYLSRERNLSKGSTVPLTQLTDLLGMKRLPADQLSEGRYGVTLEKDESGYIYAVNVKDASAVVGESAFAENIPMIPVSSLRNDGTSLHIMLEEFPKNVDILFVTYSFEGFPKGINDGTKQMINRSAYSRENIVIRSIEQRDYYIAGFVRTGGEERAVFRTLYANAKKTELRYSFAYSLLGGLKLNVRFEEDSRLPELSVRYMTGAVPVNDDLGSELCTVPADGNASKNFVISLSKLTDIRPTDNMYARVFLKDENDKSLFIPLLDEDKSPRLKGK